MQCRSIALLVMMVGIGVSGPALAGKTFTVGKGQTQGPLHITNPPYSHVVNNGKITNNGQSGVPALQTSGSVSVTNNGSITATAGGKTAKAVGVSQ